MTFREFLIFKFPLYAGKDLSEFHLPVEMLISLVEEWHYLYGGVKFTQVNHLKTHG